MSQFNTKIGRNDPCPCGSGKKYKKCCLQKDEKEKIMQQKSKVFQILSDKYFSVQDYFDNFGYSVSYLDNFLLELLNITGETLDLLHEIERERINCILGEVLYESKDFLDNCKECKFGCLNNPFKEVDFQKLIDKGLKIDEFPKELQKKIGVNFFYFEFANVYANKVKDELMDILPEDEALEASMNIFYAIISFIVDNCWQECNNKCIVDHNEDAYCSFCKIAINKPSCPYGRCKYDY